MTRLYLPTRTCLPSGQVLCFHRAVTPVEMAQQLRHRWAPRVVAQLAGLKALARPGEAAFWADVATYANRRTV